MRRRTKVCVVGLGLLMTLAAWDRVQGRSVADTMRRTQAAFLARSALHGCVNAEVSALPIDAQHTTHYEVQVKSPRDIVRRSEGRIGRMFGEGYVERVSVRHAGDARVISFPDGGQGCYDNVFIPLIVDVRVSAGLEIAIPVALRATQRRIGGYLSVPFIGSELTGVYHDDDVPPPRSRGRGYADGLVPPAEFYEFTF